MANSTEDSPSIALHSPALSSPALPLRLSLTPAGARCRLDGAWWPRSRDLERELPSLVAELDRAWGRITHATFNRHLWPDSPYGVRAGSHQVRLGWFDAEQDPDELSLFSYEVGRWDLLVVPPEADSERAARLMASASRSGNTDTAAALVEPDSTDRWGKSRWDDTRPRDWNAEGATVTVAG
ncbi:DUF5994 family protein [Streptacidiphilus albus]|uniref:DUF5994 family protein n=1 Tax=Streptacidiphilus albus TaxID=105425 RepID=UPI0005AA7803|nr:DUF5994 family protein [Streptacidiphilus albus]